MSDGRRPGEDGGDAEARYALALAAQGEWSARGERERGPRGLGRTRQGAARPHTASVRSRIRPVAHGPLSASHVAPEHQLLWVGWE